MFSFNYATSLESITINDLKNIKQNHKYYLKKETAKKRLITNSSQKKHYKKYLARYYTPWKKSYNKNNLTPDNVFVIMKNKKYYKENKQEVSSTWISKIKANMNLGMFPNFYRKAITIKQSNIRKLPSHKPLLEGFTDNSNGFPFDILQNSSIPANTPLLIKHITIDNEWVFVESSFVSGWIPIQDIAYVNNS